MALPDTNINVKANDGLTALSVAMEMGHRDLGVILYVGMSFSRWQLPYSSMMVKRPGGARSKTFSRTSTPLVRGAMAIPGLPGASQSVRSPVTLQPPPRVRRKSSNQ